MKSGKALKVRAIVKLLLFMGPAMGLAALGFSDLWLAGRTQPYIAAALLLIALTLAMALVTACSAGLYLLRGTRWVPSPKLVVLATGLQLYFDHSLGTHFGAPELAIPLGLWCLWGVLAHRELRRAPEGG